MLRTSKLKCHRGVAQQEILRNQDWGDTWLLSGPLCAQTPPEGIILSVDVDISQVGCPSQSLCNEGALVI
jgi:hypothetical protein